MMTRVEHKIDVDVPVGTAYDQWMQFECFPSFMEGVDRVIQRDDRTLEWWATVAGVQEHWRAVITEHSQNERIAWRSIDGAENSGIVSFLPLGSDRTRIFLLIQTEPDGLVERVGEATGFLDRQVSADLERFKKYIEERSAATDAGRAESIERSSTDRELEPMRR